MQNELRVAHLIGNLGVIALEMDGTEKAQPLLEESLSMCRALGNKSGMITALGKLSRNLRSNKATTVACAALYTECLAARMTHQASDWGLPKCLKASLPLNWLRASLRVLPLSLAR